MYTLKQQLYTFLMGLHAEFETARNNKLQWAITPSLDELIQLIFDEEAHLNLLPLHQRRDSTAFSAKKADGKTNVKGDSEPCSLSLTLNLVPVKASQKKVDDKDRKKYMINSVRIARNPETRRRYVTNSMGDQTKKGGITL